ncbi:melanoma-associated antigen E1 [Anguilla anguilla]|uniref:melanoma-associated antigen E1 n=1 Tax=Anguilla anguilla TaxID=7936 RepID=UPI0015AFF0EB|nr:melanoma-associated antigen E1 [Anguilla anguilla]
MASTQTLRQHNQNQARREDARNAKPLVHGATAVGSKPPNTSYAPHTSKLGTENQDPSTRNVKGTAAVKHVGTSRLPVLARSQPLQPRIDFTQVHGKWEQSFQKGKAQKKKPCTKPVPFSLSQPKATRAATVSQCKTQPTDAASANPTCPNTSQPPRPIIKSSSTAPPIKLPAATHNALIVTAHHSTLPATAHHTTLPATAPQTTLPVTAPHPALSQSNSQRTASNAGIQSRPPVPSQGAPCREACVEPTGPGGDVQFSPNPAALESILRNEGVKSQGLMEATPKSSVCPTGRGTSVYMPQRVSVLRTRPRPPGVSAGGAMQFSPDPAALSSILQNEGVNADGPPGATLRGSLCPTGRGTSVYMPQRVPVTKGHSEAAGVGTGARPSQTPGVKGTPLRVPNTRPQSAMRHFSSHRTPLHRGSPALRGLLGFGKELGPRKEEPVVQKLFEEAEQEEEESKADLEEENVSGGQKSQPKESVEGGSRGLVKDGNGLAQPFIPPPHRESVIVFSAKKVVTAMSAQQSHPDPDSFPSLRSLPTPTALPPLLPSLSGAGGGAIHWVPRLCSSGLSVRRRPRPLEECLLDEECAMFSSRPSTAATAHPRCTNPVASVLLLQNSMCFVPIDLPPLSTTQESQLICCPVMMSQT